MKRVTATASLAALLLLAGCSSAPSVPAPAAIETDPVASATDPTPASTDAAAAGAPLGDPCALLTLDEVTGILPGSAAGEPTIVANVDSAQCLWMDSATGKWIELGIGPVGTGPGATRWDDAHALWVFDLGGLGLAGRHGSLKYVDFSTGDTYQDQLEPLVAAIQSRF